MMIYNNWTDDSALWQARNGQPGSPQTLAAWDYIESRLQGCDQDLANARIDDPSDSDDIADAAQLSRIESSACDG